MLILIDGIGEIESENFDRHNLLDSEKVFGRSPSEPLQQEEYKCHVVRVLIVAARAYREVRDHFLSAIVERVSGLATSDSPNPKGLDWIWREHYTRFRILHCLSGYCRCLSYPWPRKDDGFPGLDLNFFLELADRIDKQAEGKKGG